MPNLDAAGSAYTAGNELCVITSLEIKNFYNSESHRDLTLWTNETQTTTVGAIETWVTKPDRFSFEYEPVFHRRAVVAHTVDEPGGNLYLLGFGPRREYVWQHRIVNNFNGEACPTPDYTL